MKKTALIILAAMAMAGCYDSRDVDLSFETADCNIHMGTDRAFVFGDENAWGDYTVADTIRYDGTVVQMMGYLLMSKHMGDSLTVVCYDHQKQSYLPDYHFKVTHKEGAGEWKENLWQVIDELQRQHLVRLDTAVVPAERLAVVDTALLQANMEMAMADYRSVTFSLGDVARTLRENGMAMAMNKCGNVVEPVIDDSLAIAAALTSTPADEADCEEILDYGAYSNITRQTSSRETLETRLARYGLALVPDPEGRQVTRITVNRSKGKF